MTWSAMLDNIPGGKEIMRIAGYDWRLPTDRNLICDVVKDRERMAEIEQVDGYSMVTMSKLATICQMAIYDYRGGPEGDRQPKGLRRHWYAWFKGDFSQPYSIYLGEDLQDSRWGLRWAGRLSQTYAWFVDEMNTTYRQLWVKDASRMIKRLYDRLFSGCHIVIAVEKDSLFDDFVGPAQAMGAAAVYSGKGKSSKAAIEKMLRDVFGWSESYQPFTYEKPLYVLSISDWDYDGEAVIAPTFGEQARRYTQHVKEARVGIKPESVLADGQALDNNWYQIKVNNSAAKEWAREKGLYMAECSVCEHQWPVVGVDSWEHCPNCEEGYPLGYLLEKADAHGYEVEALNTRSYYRMLAATLLSIMDFDDLVSKLRDECQADSYAAADRVAKGIYRDNESYQSLLAEFERLENIKREFESMVEHALQEEAKPMIDNWREEEDDPMPEDFEDHVGNSYRVWRPFSQDLRTGLLAEWLEESELVGQFAEHEIEF